MRTHSALLLLIGLMSSAVADDKPTPSAPDLDPDFSNVAPENDSRLAKLKDAHPQKIGLLTYYPNNGGGYTFLDGKHIAFYALPYALAWDEFLKMEVFTETDEATGKVTQRQRPTTTMLGTIGSTKLPFSNQMVCRGAMVKTPIGIVRRSDTPIASWYRKSPDGKFRFSIMAEDQETRTKLKSVLPVFERAEHAR
jgi:hypothetical protein